MDRGAWPATVLGVAKSWTRLTLAIHGKVEVISDLNKCSYMKLK